MQPAQRSHVTWSHSNSMNEEFGQIQAATSETSVWSVFLFDLFVCWYEFLIIFGYFACFGMAITWTCHCKENKLLGNTRHKCVRLSNLILANMVTFLLLLWAFRRQIFLMIEQPVSSWMFKQKCMREVLSKFRLKKSLTHLGFFGHDLLKPTHIMSSLPSMSGIETKATSARKKQHKLRMQQKRRRDRKAGRKVKEYYVRLPGGKFQGGRDLADSAIYPLRWVTEVFRCWARRPEKHETAHWWILMV